jgi:hypothetical protein
LDEKVVESRDVCLDRCLLEEMTKTWSARRDTIEDSGMDDVKVGKT